ncbi:YIP1 family protein [Desulfocurvus sp. DL9XJH121]
MAQALEHTDKAQEEGGARTRFSVGLYFKTLQEVVVSPGRFFGSMPEDPGVEQNAFRFLVISGMFYATIYLTYFFERSFQMAAILVINAIGMPFLLAGLGFVVLAMTSSRGLPFRKIFAVYAYATGTVMIVAWIPALNTITEIWKFGLVAYGLVKGCGLSWPRSVVVVLLSVALLLLLLWSAIPVLGGLAS